MSNGAVAAIGIDVGHDQLNEKLKTDPRVVFFEGVNAKNFDFIELKNKIDDQNVEQNIDQFIGKDKLGVDLVIIDLSFISLELVLPAVITCLRNGGHLLALVKPQFEVGRGQLGKGGIVQKDSLYGDIKVKITEFIEKIGLKPLNYLPSKVKGSDGNQEFFIFAEKTN